MKGSYETSVETTPGSLYFCHMMRIVIPVIVSGIILASFCVGSLPPGEPIRTRAELGEKLFSEKILSLDSSVSCASCHKPMFAFADTARFSTGIGGKPTRRNTPSVLNMKNRPYFFWDGRASSLEAQALMPIENPDEMGLPIPEAVARLNASEEYRKLFRKIFHGPATAANLAAALSSFEKTLETTDSRFDDWANGTDTLSEAEERGRQLFIDKAHCFECHFREDFTDDGFRDIGFFTNAVSDDPGRMKITGKQADAGKFKTPGLRNVGVTAPYMHDGRFASLEDVINYYDNPPAIVNGAVHYDPDLRFPLHLSAEEKNDLLRFLLTLTDKAYLTDGRNQ